MRDPNCLNLLFLSVVAIRFAAARRIATLLIASVHFFWVLLSELGVSIASQPSINGQDLVLMWAACLILAVAGIMALAIVAVAVMTECVIMKVNLSSYDRERDQLFPVDPQSSSFTAVFVQSTSIDSGVIQSISQFSAVRGSTMNKVCDKSTVVGHVERFIAMADPR